VLLVTAGCGWTRHYPLGKLAVRIIDVRYNKPVAGAAVDLYKVTPSGKVYWRASRTDSEGVAVLGAKNGGVIQGNYLIHVSFISWHDLAPGETNDRPITIKQGDDTVVTFRALARVPIRR
jgi:5-hydroxyisourate hydrolase-like protein (transthyretin family)